MILWGVLELGWTFGVVPVEARGLDLSPLMLIRHWMQAAPREWVILPQLRAVPGEAFSC